MIRSAVSLVALGIGLYIAYHYARPQLDAWRFRDAMTQTARLAGVTSDEAMRQSLLETAGELGVPLGPRQLQIYRGPRGRIVLSADWREIVTLDGGPLGVWVDTLYFAYEAASIERGDPR